MALVSSSYWAASISDLTPVCLELPSNGSYPPGMVWKRMGRKIPLQVATKRSKLSDFFLFSTKDWLLHFHCIHHHLLGCFVASWSGRKGIGSGVGVGFEYLRHLLTCHLSTLGSKWWCYMSPRLKRCNLKGSQLTGGVFFLNFHPLGKITILTKKPPKRE